MRVCSIPLLNISRRVLEDYASGVEDELIEGLVEESFEGTDRVVERARLPRLAIALVKLLLLVVVVH